MRSYLEGRAVELSPHLLERHLRSELSFQLQASRHIVRLAMVGATTSSLPPRYPLHSWGGVGCDGRQLWWRPCFTWTNRSWNTLMTSLTWLWFSFQILLCMDVSGGNTVSRWPLLYPPVRGYIGHAYSSGQCTFVLLHGDQDGDQDISDIHMTLHPTIDLGPDLSLPGKCGSDLIFPDIHLSAGENTWVFSSNEPSPLEDSWPLLLPVRLLWLGWPEGQGAAVLPAQEHPGPLHLHGLYCLCPDGPTQRDGAACGSRTTVPTASERMLGKQSDNFDPTITVTPEEMVVAETL